MIDTISTPSKDISKTTSTLTVLQLVTKCDVYQKKCTFLQRQSILPIQLLQSQDHAFCESAKQSYNNHFYAI